MGWLWTWTATSTAFLRVSRLPALTAGFGLASLHSQISQFLKNNKKKTPHPFIHFTHILWFYCSGERTLITSFNEQWLWPLEMDALLSVSVTVHLWEVETGRKTAKNQAKGFNVHPVQRRGPQGVMSGPSEVLQSPRWPAGLLTIAECGSLLFSHTEAHLAIAERNTEAQKEVDGLGFHSLAFGTVGLARWEKAPEHSRRSPGWESERTCSHQLPPLN